MQVPEESKSFLCHVGLPKCILRVEFEFDQRGVYTIKYGGPPVPSGIPQVGDCFYDLGHYNLIYRFTLEEYTGRVVLVPDGGCRESGYVNASIQQFYASCAAYQTFLRTLPADCNVYGLDPLRRQELEKMLTSIDPLALTFRESWWEFIIGSWIGDYI